VLVGFVVVTDGLGGTFGALALPRWLADSWTGVILQAGPQVDSAGSDWFPVKVAPALGSCFVTDESAKGCPFAPYLGTYVAVAGHFDDPAATTCRAQAATPGGWAGPPRAEMIRQCRGEFVVTVLGPASGPEARR
jgi:hypothetical protein